MRVARVVLSLVAPLLATCVLFAQQAQNPSPMVEHTRVHERLSPPPPAGRREPLALGTLFIPANVTRPSRVLLHFHGPAWIAEVAALREGQTAAITFELGSGSAAYARPFTDVALFSRLLAEAATKSGSSFSSVSLTAWSAGYGAVREILSAHDHYERVGRVVLIDGLHAGYAGGRPSTGPSQNAVLETESLQVFLRFARDAVAGRKRMLVTHSEIFPGTFASTTETTDWLLEQLAVARRPVLRWGPLGTQQLSEARAGRFLLAGFAGNAAPDHVDQLHSLPDYLKWLR
jgi:hypothetical protein